MDKVKNKRKAGLMLEMGILVVILSALISGLTISYMSLHKTIENNGVMPLGMSIAQDRINDIANKNFYDQYQKAQSNTVVPEIKDSDGKTVLIGDKYNVRTIYANATCKNELCYQITVKVEDPKTNEELYSSSELVTEHQSGRGLPIGTILAYSGDLTHLPYGWEIYSEMNDKFTKGAGKSDFGETGGNSTYVLKPENMPPYEFTFQFDRPMANGARNGRVAVGAQSGAGVVDFHYDGEESRYVQFGNLNLSVHVNEWTDTPFVMEPQFYKVAYIIKTKEIK